MIILAVSLAPVVVILIYVYIRDKYEKEPVGLLMKAGFKKMKEHSDSSRFRH